MTITLNLTIDDASASQHIQDAARAVGVQGVTDEEAITHVKEKIRTTLRALVIQGAEMRKRAEAEAAAQAAISSSVTVS